MPSPRNRHDPGHVVSQPSSVPIALPHIMSQSRPPSPGCTRASVRATSWLLIPASILCVLAGPVVCAAERSALAEVLLHRRVRELALVTLHEASRAHVRALQEDPLRQTAVWFHLGLIEMHAEDRIAAKESFLRAEALLQAARDPLPAEIQFAREQTRFWLRMLDGTQNSAAINAALNDSARRFPESELVLPPPAGSDRLGYRLLDPALFTEDVHQKVLQLPEISASDEERPSGIPPTTAVWRLLLMNAPETALGLLMEPPLVAPTLENPTAENPTLENPTAEAFDPSEQRERLCLQLAARLQLDPKDREIEALLSQIAKLDWLPLAGFQALSHLAPADDRLLILSQKALHALIGGRHPFDSDLLFPQQKNQQDRSEYLRDCYIELAALHERLGIKRCGFRPSGHCVEFVRAERLLAELHSPLRRSRSASPPASRLVTWALACARTGDFESWALPDAVPSSAVSRWPILVEKARIAAGDRRTHSPGQLQDRQEEVQVEPPELLLVGSADTMSSRQPPPAVTPDSISPDETTDSSGPASGVLIVGGVLLLAGGLTFAVWRWIRV